ncbi:MAG: hypothetical protein ACLQMO_08025, partial [Acidobacteriaceae bacterium]
LRRAMNPLRPATITPNFYRVAHKEIVGHAGAYVYTARPGRLRRGATRPRFSRKLDQIDGKSAGVQDLLTLLHLRPD